MSETYVASLSAPESGEELRRFSKLKRWKQYVWFADRRKLSAGLSCSTHGSTLTKFRGSRYVTCKRVRDLDCLVNKAVIEKGIMNARQ